MSASNWSLTLAYDGTDFAGWQRQPDQRTVQADLESALARLAGARVVTHAAGRTDAGVHARAQVVSFVMPRPWDAAELHAALLALTPPDMHVRAVRPAPTGFHARKHATARRYAYYVGCDADARSPFRRRYEWAVGRPLDPAGLAAAAAPLPGEHDFRAFSAAGQVKSHYRCNIAHAEWRERPEGAGFIFEVEADRFLHRMVRFLVGMAVDVALGRRPAADVGRLLQATENTDASPPAPPEGLYLMAVRYPKPDEGATG
jgi:tRNA pseudouridine38-40 synthase